MTRRWTFRAYPTVKKQHKTTTPNWHANGRTAPERRGRSRMDPDSAQEQGRDDRTPLPQRGRHADPRTQRLGTTG